MDLSQATESTSDGPARLALYSVHGWGKTTFAAHMPTPIILGAERGVPRDLGFSVKEIHPAKWMDFFDLVDGLINDRHNYETLVIDTIDWVEPMIHKFVCDRDSNRKTEINAKGHALESIEDYGWGKGYGVAEEEFRKLIGAIDVLQAKRGLHVALLMHSKVATFKNPSGPDFDRNEPKPHQRIAKVISEWAENLLFGFFQIDSAKIGADIQRNEKTARAKGVGSGIRMIGTRQTAMYDAKNRVRLDTEMEYHDPSQLIPHILGELVKRDDPMPRRPAARLPVGNLIDEEPPRDHRSSYPAGPTTSKGETDEEMRARVRHEQDDRRREDDERRDAESARIADRQRDERKRRDDEERERHSDVRGGNMRAEQNDERRDPPRDERREERQPNPDKEWTEPRRPVDPPVDDRTRGPGSAAGPVNGKADEPKGGDLIRRLTATLKRADSRGDIYRKKIDGWVRKAGDDPAKIEAIIGQVDRDIAAAESPNRGNGEDNQRRG